MELRGYTVNVLVLLLVSLARNEDRIELGLYANKVVSYGVPTPLVVTMSGYPKCELRLRVSSPRYLVAQWIVGPNIEPPMKPLFQKTDNIANELSRLHIVPSVNLSYERGYFAELNATFWQSSNIRLTLGGLCSLKSHSGFNPVARTIFLTMNISRDVCIPHAEDEACFHPNTPMEFSVMYGSEIEINLLNNCGMDTNNITWTVMDLAETTKLKTFHHQSLGLTLEPYALRFPNESGPYRNQYVLQISGDSGGRIFVARCYLKALAEAVQAIISGGIVRNVHEEEEIYMDGSPSRDYAKRPDEKQFNVYNWTCRSNDVHNTMCNGRTWTQATFLIPRKSFALGNKYEFSLSVASDIHPHQISHAHQVLLIVEFKTLQVEVTCVKNCESNAYDPEETVHMAVQCRNCGSYKPKYAWYLDGYEASQTKDLRMRLQTNNEESKVVLRAITSDFRIGTQVHLLTARKNPIYSCHIAPTTGTEVITKFNACCWKFNAKVKLFFVYADKVLIHECVYCYGPVYLPNNVTNLMALICERHWKCTKIHMPLVTVHSMGDIPTESSNDLWTYIKDTQSSYFNVNDRLRFMAVAQAAANVIREPKTALTLMKAFGEFHPRSLITLSLLAKFTKTLAINLTPIDDIDLLVMIECLTKLNENFEIVTDTNDARHLIRMPYLNTTIELIKISNFMTAINRYIAPPAKSIFDQYNQAVKDKKLQQPVIDDLLEEISQIDSELVKEHSEKWVRSLWQTERLCRFLSSARKHGVDSNDTAGVVIDTMTLAVHCMLFKPGLEYAIDTNDARHTVYLSSELLDELKDPLTNKVCIKIISKIRRLNWWYPEERQPSNELLTVHANKTGYEFQEELRLHNSHISFRTVTGRFKPALDIPKNQEIESIFQQLDLDTSRSYGQQIEGKSRSRATASQDESDNDDTLAETGKYGSCLEYGQLNTKMQLLAYRMQLQQRSMVAVRFKNTTHRLNVLLVMKNLPTNLVSAIADSECSVPAHSTNTTMVRSCDHWKQSEQHWQHINCLPGLQYPRQGYIYCNCSMMGTFTSYVYYVPAIAVPINITKDILFNWVVLSVYIVALLGTFIVLVLLFRYHNHQPSKTIACDMTDLEEASDRDVHDLLIYLRTGCRDNALTTATVRLIFETTKRAELQFTLMQNPESPELTRNSTYILWLRSRDIRIPTRIAVVHNNEGRYPTWYLYHIEVIDIQTQQVQVFKVNRWVRHKFLILSSSMVVRPGDQTVEDSWRDRFVAEFERQWLNWGLWQPLTGKWRGTGINDTMTRAQRVCIFLNKLIITYTVCACVWAPAKQESAYQDTIYFNYRSFLLMVIISLILTNLAQYILESLLLLSH
ncbi:PREDICTED: uncharacterized protein LOC108611229 isoform X2 [Drosophila arizonae]|uniref:Uncharacterized protein LOC108611229 isoform X2 n=1 Tax=Drosophila arizonae TaxID=7263 RepID=A0ABM1NW99_DROAR|nr:PREDICTED: uncharacterized protein LOC108611229 isoform X2 [Drosophila arizonae]